MMFRNYSKKSQIVDDLLPDVKKHYSWRMLIVLPAWVFTCLFTAQLLAVGLIWLVGIFKIDLSKINESIYNAALAAFVYIITLIFVIGAPFLVKKRHTYRSELGLSRLPFWSDIVIAPAGFIVYLILSSLLILLATHIMPWFDVNQTQNTGFSHLNGSYEYIAAFITLVVLAPVAEEVLFRGYLFGKLKKYVPVWLSVVLTSVVFGAAHGAWNLAIDTFALSIILCLLRQSTGSLWASILLHMTKNGIAYYFLFINPLLLAIILH